MHLQVRQLASVIGLQPVANKTEIEESVVSVLRRLAPRGTIIRPEQKLIADLKLLSDDATAMTINLERKYRIKIPREEWGVVLTVQDVIDLLHRHVR
jgi:acyl carrier protein